MITELDSDAIRIYWQESFENNNEFNEHAVAHYWYNDQMHVATSKGVHVIRSASWYLDVQVPG